jgi:sugar transferase (PEP-CTERM/EpsH1 system associated)
MKRDRLGPKPEEGPAVPIRVVHVVTTLNVGGLERVVLDLVRRRRQDAFDARVVCLDASGLIADAVGSVGVPVDTIGTGGSVPRRVLRLARRLRQLKPDVLHTHNPQAHVHGALAARLAGVPAVVHTKHGRGILEGRTPVVVTRLATAWTSRFVAVSQDAARVAMEAERVPAAKVVVIHNGIDVDRYAAPGTRPPATKGRGITVGRLDPIKDQSTMLRAVRLVVNRMPGFQLDIVGDGPSRAGLVEECAALDLGDRVNFLGYQADVAPYLAAADLFVLSSESEGVPLALLEAMASGLPAVATDVGGLREVIVPGETGRLVPARSPDELARAILDIAADPGERDRMGGAARRRVVDHFNLRTVVARYEELYLECLGRRLPPARGGA